MVKGYKVFNKDWTCRGKQYSCPGVFEEDGDLEVCGHGMHFCKTAADCFEYYKFNSENHVAEVIAHGTVLEDGNKCCTDKLEIVREISWDEVLRIVNTGKQCTGLWNSGNRNSGNWNSGNWNITCFSNGCFNTVEPKIYLFDKPSDWTYRDWLNSEARYLLNQISGDILEWVYFVDMTDEEKKNHPEAKTTGGYLKELDTSECAQVWWDNLSERQRNIIKAIPNFDPEIFSKITGIKFEN